MLRGAFIGFGNVAANGHLPGWLARKDVAIVAATDAVASRREAFQAALPDGRWVYSVDELLSDPSLDFVDICAPPGAHAALVEGALAAGLHVLCEKPLVTKIEDMRVVAGAAARAGRVAHTVHNWLKAPICAKISALIDEGAIGAVRSVDWRTLRSKPAIAVSQGDVTNWRVDPALAGGGILFDHGWHALYCVSRWAGAPRGVAATLETRRFHEWPLEDTATLALDNDAGVSRIHLTWTAEERSNHIDIEGDDGRLRIAGDIIIVQRGSTERRWSCPPALSQGSHHPDWFDGVAADFLDAIKSGGQGNLQEAALCAGSIDLAQRSSAASGVRLSVEEESAA